MSGSQRSSPATASALVLLLGLSVAYFTWTTTSNTEYGQKKKLFEQRASLYRNQLEASMLQQIDLLRFLSEAYATDDNVTENDLTEFVSEPFTNDTRYKALRTVAWVVRLPEGGVRSYERVKRLEPSIAAEFRVHQHDGQPVDDVEPHAVVDQLYPPHLSYQLIHGLDLSTMPEYAMTLKTAAKSGEPAMSAGVELLADEPNGDRRGVMVAIPVEPGGRTARAQMPEGASVTGFVVGLFSLKELLDQAQASVPEDDEFRDRVRVVLSEEGKLLEAVGLGSPVAEPPYEGLHAEGAIHILGRLWGVEIRMTRPMPLTVDELLQRASTLLTASVCIMMLLFAWIAWTLSRQNVVIQQRVAQQTAELRQQNLVLEGKERELNEANRRLLEMSNTDALTGILNRRAFEVQVDKEHERSLRTGLPFGLLVFDVDQFKDYNDRYGHAAGDEVLRRVAAIINAEARRIDTVARYGGEEFVVLATGADAGGLLALGERIRGRIQDAGIEHGSAPKGVITVSGGGSLSSATLGHDPRAAFDVADRCLYEAKSTGRNRVVMVM